MTAHWREGGGAITALATVDGIYRVEHTPGASDVGDCRMRVLFAGTPIDDTPPKTAAAGDKMPRATKPRGAA